MKKIEVKYPPMGWNSWDCYGAATTESDIRRNAEYMAKYMKKYGWKYVVNDIQWYQPTSDNSAYIPFEKLEMDKYGRLIPAVNRFPSSAEGKGFKPLADYIHSLGLKYGIHIMRGIPRQAVHKALPILGSNTTAKEIAHPFSICSWNTDMYGVNPDVCGAQEYYNSVFDLFAEWGIDFVKVDDISNTYFDKENPYSAKGEIELIRHAINQSGRDIVFSLSPGPAPIEQVEHLKENADIWRITADFWERWEDLNNMFEICNIWSKHV